MAHEDYPSDLKKIQALEETGGFKEGDVVSVSSDYLSDPVCGYYRGYKEYKATVQYDPKIGQIDGFKPGGLAIIVSILSPKDHEDGASKVYESKVNQRAFPFRTDPWSVFTKVAVMVREIKSIEKLVSAKSFLTQQQGS